MKIFFRLFFLILLFSACASGKSIYLPGEKSVVINELVGEYYAIADAYFKLGQYDKAMEYYERTLTLGYKNKFHIIYKKAQCAALLSKWDIAIENYSRLYAIDNENTNIAKSLAWVYGQKGNFDKAIALYTDLHTQHIFDNETYTNLILLYIAKKDVQNATQTLTEYKKNFLDTNTTKLDDKLKNLINEIKEKETADQEVKKNQ